MNNLCDTVKQVSLSNEEIQNFISLAKEKKFVFECDLFNGRGMYLIIKVGKDQGLDSLRKVMESAKEVFHKMNYHHKITEVAKGRYHIYFGEKIGEKYDN
jgi:hypothetical protein